MKQMVAVMFALVAGVGFPASAVVAESVLDAGGASPVSAAETPPDKPEDDQKPGGETPPDKPSGEGGGSGGGEGTGGGGGGGGSSDSSVILTGANSYTSETNALADATLTSTTSDQNVILAMTNAYVTVSNCVLNKSGDTSSEDNSNFFALNAVVAAKTASMICIADSKLNSNANGANCLFASGSGSTIYAYDCTLNSTNDSSRGLDATYGGTVIASKMSITTFGDHCASLATDRGNGYISVEDATLSTAGQGSALVYSTGCIEVNSATGSATGAQIAGIEGLSTIRIKNSDLTGSGEKASEPVANGVIIYQSNSGDSTEGTATFEVSDSTLTSAIKGGAMFYITNSKGVITVQNTDLAFDSSTNCLVKAAGNNGDNGWGTEGSNGADVLFTAIDQTLVGNISVDGISSLDLCLTNSTYTGTFIQDTAYTGDGGSDLFISSDSTWVVTKSCTLQNLTAAPGAKIVDGSGNTVSIVNASGTTFVSGTSDPKVTVSTYTLGTFATTNITPFEIDRTAFGKMYGTSQGQGGDSGSSSGTGSKTYYFKPHAPTNGVVGVSYNGEKIYPDMDHKYWLDDYWTNGVTVTIDFSSNTTTGYFFADGSSVTSLVLTITENRIDVYPPAGFETAYLAQAKSGATYYPTLKAAIDAGKKKITLTDSITLDESLTVTNAITLNLNTNTITLASTLTNAFHFTAGATVSNGTINASLVTDVESSAVLCFTGGKVTLSDLILIGNGCLLYVDDVKSLTLTNNCYNAPTVLRADATTAASVVAAINSDKAGSIAVPTGVEESVKDTYLSKVEATVTSDNRVVVALTSEAAIDEQNLVDAAVTNETVFASLVSTNLSATATISPTTPGLYYWIVGGTDVGAVTNAGAGVLSTDGGAVELSKPTLDTTAGSAFFRIAVGVQAPAR